MNCPSCGAPMHLKPDMESFRCDYCQSVYFPEKNEEGVRVLDEQSDQACPICNLPLVEAAMGKTRILYCAKCHGMLIAMLVLPSLIDELQADSGGRATAVQPASDIEDLRRKIDCPKCHHAMDAHFYAGPGGVIVDSCEECCLIWLDRGGLMRIVHASDGTIAYSDPLPGDPDGPMPENSLRKPDSLLGDIAATVIREVIGDPFKY